MKREIPCAECHGKGKVPLHAYLAETLAMIPVRGSTTATDLHEKHLVVSPNAFSNRLMELLDLGFVTRERSGKFWQYSRA